MPSRGLADVIPPSRHRAEKPFVDTLPSVIRRSPIPNRLPLHDSIFSKIVTPYNADTFESSLLKHKLIKFYPFLIRNLRNGFPFGEFPNLSEHVIFPIHNTALPYMEQIDAYLAEEVDSGQMSGPFTLDETTLILKGPFQCSPIVVDVQPDKLRICRHLSKESKRNASVNSYIDSEKFPTRFGSAAEVAEIVSPPYHPYPVFPIPSYPTAPPSPSVLSYPSPFVLPLPYLASSLCELSLTFLTHSYPSLPDRKCTPWNPGHDAGHRQVSSNLSNPPGPQAVVRHTRFGWFLH